MQEKNQYEKPVLEYCGSMTECTGCGDETGSGGRMVGAQFEVRRFRRH